MKYWIKHHEVKEHYISANDNNTLWSFYTLNTSENANTHRLKRGAILILLRNTIQRLFNGTRSVLRTLSYSVTDHKIIAEQFRRNRAFILRITLSALGQTYHTN
jgi:hypothetical protein